MRRSITVTMLLGTSACVVLCGPTPADEQQRPSPGTVRLTVELQLDREVYSQTRYKNPPQFAVWIENRASGEIRTLYVTPDLGQGKWDGKTTCPVALPYWVSRYNKEAGTVGEPSKEQPVPDAISQPTPTDDFRTATSIPAGGNWMCYVEANASGDFNDAFPAAKADAAKDTAGNGQPSIIYRAKIQAAAGRHSKFEVIGRTSQLQASPQLHEDVAGMTTAKKLFSRLRVRIDPES